MTTTLPALPSLTRPRTLLLVFLVWAGIYLPALGTLEIKGEEGRRILPAVTMLGTGDWIVPHVGGEPYLSKPPLINWLVAGAFRLTGVQNEWAARLPSVLAMLALGLGLAWRGGDRALLGPSGGLVAAVFALTSVGMMEKGRLVEIEALYVACYGLALVDWLAAWRAGASPWRQWLVPAVPLGLGLLTKGPLLLLFFYAVVGAILWRAGRLRELAHPAAVLGLALTAGMFLAWAVPYWHAVPAGKVGRAWTAQFTGRLRVEEGGFRFRNWVQNVPRGLFNFLPWALLLPLLWRQSRRPRPPAVTTDEESPPTLPPADRGNDERNDAVRRGGRDATVACFLMVSLLPGGLPRYTLPLVVPAALLLARAVRGRRFGKLDPTGLTLAGAALCVGITLLYAAFVVPRQRRHGENLHRLAQRVNETVGDGPVEVLAPGYQPFLFYLRPAPRYVRTVDELLLPRPASTAAPTSPPVPDQTPSSRFLLVKESAFAEATTRLDALGLPWQPALILDEKNRGRYRLLRLPAPARAYTRDPGAVQN